MALYNFMFYGLYQVPVLNGTWSVLPATPCLCIALCFMDFTRCPCRVVHTVSFLPRHIFVSLYVFVYYTRCPCRAVHGLPACHTIFIALCFFVYYSRCPCRAVYGVSFLSRHVFPGGMADTQRSTIEPNKTM